MPALEILTFGSPEVRLFGERVVVKPKKAFALLLYLAASDRVQVRDSLATLLWPDDSQRQARAALRRRLSELNSAIGDEWLFTDGEQVSLEVGPDLLIDRDYFEQALAACHNHGHAPDEVCPACLEPLETAADLYRGDFLSGFTLADCPDFDDWQVFQAEELRQELASVLERLVRLYCDQSNSAAAIRHARRWAALDPLHEPAHRALMQLYHEGGQRAAALRQYELCVQTLDAELGVPPEAGTTNLYNSIRSGQATAPRPHRAPEPARSVPTPQTVRPAPPMDEVRMATVLALEVDAAKEEDWDRRPDEMLERMAGFLRRAPDLLDRYEAHITSVHDSGFQAVFGLSELHEDDAERAVHAALALQESARTLDLAIVVGISTGMVYVSQSPRGGARTTTGPTVNLALRLKGQAPSGSVMADAKTYHQVEQSFRFVSHHLSMLGRPEPVAVYEVQQERRHTVKSRGIGSLHAPLIGRSEELARLVVALDKARQGQGQLVTVTGEAGLGKSRLVAELKAAAMDAIGADADAGVLWLEGRCQEMNRSVAYWPFIDIVQTFFGWMPYTPEAERSRLVASTLAEFMQQQRLSEEQVTMMGPILGQLLSLHFGNDWDERLQNARPEQIRYQTFRTLRDLFTTLAQRRPLVLVLEDLHWADPLTLDLIGHLMEMLEDTSLLLLCVYRPEAALAQDRLAAVATRKCPEAFTEIRLRELTPDNSRALVEALLHVEGLSPATTNRILDASQGNPFFLEEVIHDLIEAGLLYCDGVVWRAHREIESTPVPSRVQSVILARVDRLDVAYQLVLQHAAVIGRLFSPEVLARSMPQEANLDDALAALEARAFIYPEQTVPGTVYSFRHVLAQEAVYATIPGQRRAALHERVGETLEWLYGGKADEVVDQLSYHFDRSDNVVKAISYLLASGDKAARAYATDEAVAHYRRALQRIDMMKQDEATAQWRFHALSEMGKTLMRSSRYDEAETALRQAIAWGREHDLPVKEVARLYWWLGDLLMNWKPRHDQTLQAGLDGLALLGTDEAESVEAAMLYSIVAFGYYFLVDLVRFQETTTHLAGFLNRLPYAEEFRVCYGCIMEACLARKDLSEYTTWLDIAEQRARLHHDDWALGEHLEERSALGFFTGEDPGIVQAYLREARSLFERVGDSKRMNWADVDLAVMMGYYGQVGEAEMHLRSVLASTYEWNAEHAVSVLLLLAANCIAQCKWSEARQVLQETRQQMDARRQNPAEALTLLGFVELGSGNTASAVDIFSRALNSLEDPDSLLPRRRKWYVGSNSFFANALYGLESALDDADAFRDFCRKFRAEHPAAEQAMFAQWHLDPASVAEPSSGNVASEQFDSPLPPEWIWCDPSGGCLFEVDGSLTIKSRAARDLWSFRVGAPRIMRPIKDDFITQVTCEPACTDRPGVGGILLWQDKSNYLRLSIGVRAQDETSLDGCIANRDVVIGRGRLATGPITLRMERSGNTVRALCRAVDQEWFGVGKVEFPASGPLQVGLVAIGSPDRIIYQAPYPDGTAIRFTDFLLWS